MDTGSTKRKVYSGRADLTKALSAAGPPLDAELHRRQIGERLRLAREAIGYRAVDICRLHNVEKTKYSHWERGVHYPDYLFLVSLWRHHKIPTDFILTGDTSGLPLRVADNLPADAKAAAAA